MILDFDKRSSPISHKEDQACVEVLNVLYKKYCRSAIYMDGNFPMESDCDYFDQLFTTVHTQIFA